jgi:general stress protein CsbA
MLSIFSYFIIFTGLVSFLIGYWFLAKSKGEDENSSTSAKNNFIGGLIGIIIGVIFLIYGFILSKKQIQIALTNQNLPTY